MKIRRIVKKDLRLFKRDKKNIVLIVLVPILVISILALIFGQSTASKSISGSGLGLCNLDDAELGEESNLFKFKEIFGEDCDERVPNLVTKGQLKAAVIVPERFQNNIEEGKGSELILYVDNSKYQTALVITDSVKAMVQDINEKVGTKFIENAWLRLRELNNRLKLIISHLETAKTNAEKLQKRADEINKNLDKLNEKELDLQLNNLNQSILNISLPQNINLSSEIDNDIVNLNNILSNECPNNLPQQECNIINESIFNLNRVKSNLRNNEIKINNLLKSTNTTALSQQISIIKKSKAEIKRDIINLNNSIYNYTNNIITIANELNKTSEFLDVYTNRDPKNIVRAVTLKIKNVFGNRTYFEFLAPGLILTMLLFTTLLIVSSNIVEERKKGTLARTLLSPTRIPTLIFAKNLYFLILCLIEIIAMLIIAVLFGVSLDITLGSIIILVLAAINFIAIGLFIGSVSTSENTALLTSLVITLPMFFLSNQFFPLDIMPGFIKSLGSIMPLTLSIHNLDRLIIYGTEINVNQIMLLIIYPLIISFFSYLMIKRKPTSN